jgi:hypothetical protein
VSVGLADANVAGRTILSGIRIVKNAPALGESPKVVIAGNEVTKQSIRRPIDAPKQPEPPYGLLRFARLERGCPARIHHQISPLSRKRERAGGEGVITPSQ